MENPVVAVMQLQLEVVRQSVSLSNKIVNVVVRNQPRVMRALAPLPVPAQRIRPASRTAA